MGYTHYWRVIPHIPQEKFDAIRADFEGIIPTFGHLGIPLGDGFGENTPVLTNNSIVFNGLKNCGHKEANVGLMWPSENAGGTSQGMEKAVAGEWCGGITVDSRMCGGDCSYEGVVLERTNSQEQDKNGKVFDFCKTNYKPYDIAVQAFLIIARHHLKDDISVSSDGDDKDWTDAREFCQHFLGYGGDFTLHA